MIAILVSVVLTVPFWLGLCAWAGLGWLASLGTLIIALAVIPILVLCSITASGSIMVRVTSDRGDVESTSIKQRL